MALSASSLRSAVGLATATSANGATRNGASQVAGLVEPGTLLLEVVCTIVTGSVVATFTPQVSFDGGTTWRDLRLPNNAALVTFAATGSAVLSSLPVSGATHFRCNALLSGAATAGGDTTTVTYRWVRYGASR